MHARFTPTARWPLRHSRSQPVHPEKARRIWPWTRSSALSKPPIPSLPQSRRASGRTRRRVVAALYRICPHGSRTLGAFARPLGVRPLVENLTGDPTTPEHLMEILKIGHFDSIGVCLDLGHAHITVGVPQAIATFADRIVQVHAHDNQGQKDEHLWPVCGGIDWRRRLRPSTPCLRRPPWFSNSARSCPTSQRPPGTHPEGIRADGLNYKWKNYRW